MTSRLTPRPASDGSAPPAPSADLPPDLARVPILILYPHSRCNCRCTMCDIWQASGSEELPAARVAAEAAAWRAHGVERVVLSGGEPLMHSDLWSLVTPLVTEGIGITLVTTGLLLARHAPNVARWVDDVVVSLDGPPATHDDIRRVPRAYARLAEGVAAVRAATGADGGTRISARTTVQRANYRGLPETVATARSLGLDGISFLAVDQWSEAFNRPGGWSAERRAEVGLTADELPQLDAQLSRLEVECAAEFAAGFIAESPAKLRRSLGVFAAALGAGDWPRVSCNAPWVSAVVEADGTLRPCFFHRAVGRWDGGGLMSAVNGADAVAFRSDLVVAENEICRRCVCSINLAVPEAQGATPAGDGASGAPR